MFHYCFFVFDTRNFDTDNNGLQKANNKELKKSIGLLMKLPKVKAYLYKDFYTPNTPSPFAVVTDTWEKSNLEKLCIVGVLENMTEMNTYTKFLTNQNRVFTKFETGKFEDLCKPYKKLIWVVSND